MVKHIQPLTPLIETRSITRLDSRSIHYYDSLYPESEIVEKATKEIKAELIKFLKKYKYPPECDVFYLGGCTIQLEVAPAVQFLVDKFLQVHHAYIKLNL